MMKSSRDFSWRCGSRGAHVADAATKGSDQAEIAKGGRGQADGVVEEAAQEVDAALALADEHDQVFGFRVVNRSRLRKIALHAVIAEMAILRETGLDRHDFEPP